MAVARGVVAYLDENRQKVIVELDYAGDVGLSKSGKSRIVAVGTLPVPGCEQLKVSVTLYRMLSRREKLAAAANLPAA